MKKNREVENNPYCYFAGKIMPLGKAKISPFDLGVLRGYAVFDVMYAQENKAFLLDAHWARLENSAKELGMTIPTKKKEFEAVLKKLLEKNGHSESTIRTVITGGESADAFTPKRGNEIMYILVGEFHHYPDRYYRDGVKVITMDFNRDIPRAKVTNYVRAIREEKRKKKEKALEIVYLKDGKALEASTSNFFIVKDGVIITPQEGILFGTTRNLVIKLALENGFIVEEGEVSAKEFFKADEMFIAATNKHIVPVVNIDGKKVKNGKVGPVTKKLMALFEIYMEKYFEQE